MEPKKYGAIAADPGTPFDAYSAKGETSRSPQKKYTTKSDEEIAAMPVHLLAARDCFLFYWDTTARIAVGRHIPIMKAWGFKPTAFAFTWFKLNLREPATPFFLPRHSMNFGPGLTTRKNTEVCILGRRGSPRRMSKSIREEIFAPRREHSRKPEEFYDRVKLYAAGPYAELFSRTNRPGWDVWGDQAGKFNEAAE
ncbi:MAG: MT-A70 family methyltransferase [Hyphomicrobium sp.]